MADRAGGVLSVNQPDGRRKIAVRQHVKRGLALLIAVLALIQIGRFYVDTGHHMISERPSSDFYKFYLSGKRLSEGKSVYWVMPPSHPVKNPCRDDQMRAHPPAAGSLVLGGDTPCLAPNLNPPFFMVLTAPFSSLPYPLAWWIWAALSATCALASIWLAAQTLSTGFARHGELAVLGAALFFSYLPTYTNHMLGQVSTLLLLPMVLGWRALRQGQTWQPGMWLGLAIGLKPLLSLFILALVWLRLWRASLTAISTTLATLAVGGAWLGWESYAQYQEILRTVTWTASNWNGSFIGFFDRASDAVDPVAWPHAAWAARSLATACCGLVLWMAGALLWKAKTLSTRSMGDALFLLVLPCILLISPLGWIYYFPWLGLSAVAAWHLSGLLQDGHPRGLLRFAWTVPWVITMVPLRLLWASTAGNAMSWWGVDAMNHYALLAVLSIAGVTVARVTCRDVP